MTDPLAEIVTLLQPRASRSKIVSGAGAWSVRRQGEGQPFYCVVLDGSCHLEVDAQAPIALQANDFVLIPSVGGFAMLGSGPAASADAAPSAVSFLPGEVRHGIANGPPDVRLLVGHCAFGSPDASLLVSLLPRLVLVRGEARLTAIVRLVVDESRARRPARDVVLARLLEVLFIEALRGVAGDAASPAMRRRRGSCAGCPTDVCRSRSGACTKTRPARGPSRSWRARRRFRARRSSSGSAAR